MKILHVINQLSGNAGAEVSLQELLLALDGDRDFDHVVATLRASSNNVAALDPTRVQVLAPPGDLGLLSGLRFVDSCVRRTRPDLLHATLTEANILGRLVAWPRKLPVLVSVVNTPYVGEALMNRQISLGKHRFVRSVDALLSRNGTAHFHAITDVVAQHAVDAYGVPRDRITVVPRGRDRARLGLPSRNRRRSVRAELGAEDEPILLNVGRQEPQKGQIYAIRAMSKVWASHPNARLLIAGREGNSSESLRAEVGRVGAGDRIRFLGNRSDIGDLLAAADIFVFPSLYEGLGGSVLEAMAMDVPIVATDAPALVEVLAGGQCARLVPTAAPDALADAVVEMLSDRTMAEHLAGQARARFESTYTLQCSVDGMRALYRRLGEESGVL